jgi:hypothetical protein
MSQFEHSDSQYPTFHYAESFIDPDTLQPDDFLEFPSEVGGTSTPLSDYPVAIL